MPDSTLSALSNIRTKIRRLTRSPSTSQLSVATLDEYINNFILYDFPAHVKLDALRTTLTFYTIANVATYSTDTTTPTAPLYNFKNRYTNIQTPISIAGSKSSLSQNRDEFYDIYPLTETRIDVGTGNGVTVNFTGTLSSTPILQNYVTVSSLDTADDRILVTDDGDGNLTGTVGAASTINYLTGAYDVTFLVAPKTGESVWINYIPYTANKPQSVLFVEDEFVLRPVPDGVYSVSVIAYQRLTEMSVVTDLPELSEWWQYIAYGASIKILQDRLDQETVDIITPEFINQEILIGRRTIIQNSGKRTKTIFTSGYKYGSDRF